MNSQEIIASRAFRGVRNGVEVEFTAVVGMPRQAAAPDMYFSCPYEIVDAAEDPPVRQGRGIDALQALQLALRMLEVDLVALKEDCDGQLSWSLAPSMGLGLAWPDK